MNDIFSTEERIRILKAVIYAKGMLRVNSLASKLRLSKGLISKYLDILVKSHVLRRVKGKFLVTDSHITKGIKIMFNIADIPLKLFTKYKFIKAVGVYGSCAKGENDEESDMDIWVKVEEVSDQKIAKFVSALKRKVSKADLLVLTSSKLDKLKKNDTLFYHSLVFGSIAIYGENDAL